MRKICLIAGLAMFAAAPAAAEVKTASDTGFDLVFSETVSKSPEEVWAALKAPAKWWNKAHTYSGDATNLWMDAQAGGCFCEKLPGEAGNRGSVEHARILYAQPGKVLRLQGAFGPLQAHPVIGIMTFTLKPADGGGTTIGVSYVLGGHVAMGGGTAAIAPLVDKVLGQQVAGLKAFVDAPVAE
jgi:uncharacterized protein YndB with AHSA1/START domain